MCGIRHLGTLLLARLQTLQRSAAVNSLANLVANNFQEIEVTSTEAGHVSSIFSGTDRGQKCAEICLIRPHRHLHATLAGRVWSFPRVDCAFVNRDLQENTIDFAIVRANVLQDIIQH